MPATVRTVRATLSCGHRLQVSEYADDTPIKARVSTLRCEDCGGHRRVESVSVLTSAAVPVTEPGTIRHAPGVGYFVASRTTPGAWWLVQGRACSCPAGGRESCWHRGKVQDHCAAENRRLARPVVPVNISALVD